MAGMTFSREKNRVQVDAYGLMIDEIRAVWEKDRTRIKEKATALISYIHLSAQVDPEAPFFGAKSSEVKELSARNIWRDDIPRNIEQYDDTIVAYRKAYETADVRVLKTFSDKIDEIQELIGEQKPKITENYNDKTGAVSFATNMKIITDAMKDINGLIDEKEKLEQRIKKELANQISTLGQKKPSRLERQQMNG